MADEPIRPKQRWRRKSDGVVVTVVSQAGDPQFDDWHVRNHGARSSRRIFGWNLHRLYELTDPTGDPSTTDTGRPPGDLDGTPERVRCNEVWERHGSGDRITWGYCAHLQGHPGRHGPKLAQTAHADGDL